MLLVWFLYVENADFTTKENSEHLRAIALHKKRISLLLDLGEVESEFSTKTQTGDWYGMGSRPEL